MAASAIGALRVTLGIDTAAFTDGLSAAQKRMAATSDKLKAVGGKIALVGAGMSAALTGPLAAFGKDAFTAASDAAELQSSFDTTFGKMSSTMNKWAETTGDAMGRSTQEMQKAANTFGIFFNTAVDPAKAAQMSQTFAKLAQDLGSFYNVDTETAIEKLRSGLSGESEPLRDFGVFLTEATVKAKGLQLGLTGVGNEFTEQEKITARYALIMEATTKAQGDVVRTASGTANQMRATKAAFEELQVTVGTKLLPALTPLITALGTVLTAMTSLPAPVQTGIVAVAALGAALGPVTIGVGGLVAAFSTVVPALSAVTTFLTASLIPAAIATAPVWAPIAAAVGLAAGAFALLIKYQPQIDAFGEAVVARMRALYIGVKTWLSDKLNAVFDAVKAKVSAVGDAFYTLWDRVVGHSYIPDMVDAIGDHMGRLNGNMVDAADDATKSTAEKFATMAEGVVGTMQGLFNSIQSKDWGGLIGGILGAAKQLGAFGNGTSIGGADMSGWGSAGSIDVVGMGGSGAQLPGFATGGSFQVRGMTGVDKNMLSLNGQPIARVSHGETVGVGRGGSPAVIQLAVEEGSLFRPTVRGISGDVSVETVGRSNRIQARAASRRLR